MSKEVVVKIDKKGGVSIEAFGFKGVVCETELSEVIKELGDSSIIKPKAERYVSAESQIITRVVKS